MTFTKPPVVHKATLVGTVLGALVWLGVYASHFSSGEFDGPAGLALALTVATGGVIGGLAGLTYDLKHGRSFKGTFLLFLVSVFVSCSFIGISLGMYAKDKWDYSAAHPTQCNVPQDSDAYSLACG